MLGHIRLLSALRGRLFRLVAARRFRRFGKGSWILAPNAIEGAANIAIGDDVYVARNIVLAAVPLTSGADCRLEIGDGCRIGHFNHIYATRRIVFGRKVLTADGVYVSDNVHRYDDPDAAIMDQSVRQLADVTIGDGTWLGHNVVVLGASIGRNCVVGANSVVLSDLPDHCVAVGAPARIVRRYDAGQQRWRAVDRDGAFRIDEAESGRGTP